MRHEHGGRDRHVREQRWHRGEVEGCGLGSPRSCPTFPHATRTGSGAGNLQVPAWRDGSQRPPKLKAVETADVDIGATGPKLCLNLVARINEYRTHDFILVRELMFQLQWRGHYKV